MKKKHLRRALHAAEAESARLADQARAWRGDGEAIAEALAEAIDAPVFLGKP